MLKYFGSIRGSGRASKESWTVKLSGSASYLKLYVTTLMFGIEAVVTSNQCTSRRATMAITALKVMSLIVSR